MKNTSVARPTYRSSTPASFWPRVAWSLLALAVTAVVVTGTAMADENLEKAKERYAEGRQAYQSEDYATAIARFEEAYTLKPNDHLLFYIFKSYDQLGRSGKALGYLKRYAATKTGATKDVRDQLTQYETAIFKKIKKSVVASIEEAISIATPGGKVKIAKAIEVEESGPLFEDVPVGITSDPPGAKIFVDDKEWGSVGTTPTNIRMFTGKHTIWVQKDFYGEKSAEIFVRPVLEGGKPQQIAFALERDMVPVEIKTNPPSAKIIYIKDSGERLELGAGRFSGNLPAGVSRFVIQSVGSGTKTFEESIVASRVDESGSMFLQFDLRNSSDVMRDNRTKTGDLVVQGYLLDADIYVDGKYIGETPGPVRTQLSVGAHTVELRKEGHVTRKETVRVEHNQVTNYKTPDSLPIAEEGANLGGWLLTSVGVAAAGGGAFFTVQSLQKKDDADAATTEEERSSLNDEADQAQLISFGLYGLAGASIIGGILFFALSGGDDASAALDDRAPSWQLALTPLTDGGGFVFALPF